MVKLKFFLNLGNILLGLCSMNVEFMLSPLASNSFL